MTEWFALDPAKADYGSRFGARVNGITLLEMPSGAVAVTGLMSCASREGAERAAWACRGPVARREIDRRISAATLRSWR